MIRKAENTSTATNPSYSLSYLTTGNNTNMLWQISFQINIENFFVKDIYEHSAEFLSNCVGVNTGTV